MLRPTTKSTVFKCERHVVLRERRSLKVNCDRINNSLLLPNNVTSEDSRSDELAFRKHHNIRFTSCRCHHVTLTETFRNCLPVVSMTSQTRMDVGEAAVKQHAGVHCAKRTLYHYTCISSPSSLPQHIR